MNMEPLFLSQIYCIIILLNALLMLKNVNQLYYSKRRSEEFILTCQTILLCCEKL